MNVKRLVVTVLVVALIASLCAGCGGSKPADNAEAPTEKTEAPAEKKTTLVVAQISDASILDPQKQGKMPDMNILINIFDTLVTRDENGQLAPSLATEWEPIDDVTWQFKLREGVKFHNGEPFNAEAVKFSLDRLINPETKSPIAELRNLKQCDIVDEYTVNLVTAAPDPIIPNKLVLFGGVILPPQYVQEKGDDYIAKNPVGTGPYKYVSWHKDAKVVMEANKEYWRGVPAFDNLEFRVIPNWADVMAALKAGEIDIVQGVPSDLAATVANDPNIKTLSSDWIRTFFVSLDTAVSPLDKKEVRQALNYAVDKDGIIANIFNGNAKKVATIIPRENFGYDESIEAYPYDPEKAKELLAAAGYPDGFEIDFEANSAELTEIQAIIGYLEAVGVKVNLKVTDSKTLVSNMQAKKAAPMYYIGNTGWTMDALSNFQSYAKSDRRYARATNAELDALVDIEETTVDPAKRQEAFTKAQQILKEEAYFIYLWQQNNIITMSKDVDFTPNKNGVLWMYSATQAK